jgi:nitroreductase
MVAENIILLAAKYGLGTVPEIQAVFYPEVLRKMLAIPESKLIVLGIAIGYPDWDDPVNKFRSERDPLDEVIRWHGFEPQGE